MLILDMFRASAFIGLAWCACLATILWCVILLPKLTRGHVRFLVGLIGLIAVYQGLRLLWETGVWKPIVSTPWENAASFVVCTMYLLALLVVEVFGAEHRTDAVQLRLADAELRLAEAETVESGGEPLQDRVPGSVHNSGAERSSRSRASRWNRQLPSRREVKGLSRNENTSA